MTLTVVRKTHGAELVARSEFNIGRMDQGIVTHPTYGHGPSVQQRIRAGFWSDVVEQAKARVIDRADKAVERVIKDVG
jgi:hypothetical protein